MLRKPTLLALVVLTGLIAFTIYLSRDKEAPAGAEPTQASDSYVLFGSQEGMPNHIVISSRMQQVVELSRIESGEWIVTLPMEAPADQAQAEAAATQVSALRVLDETDLQARDVGLSPVEYTITLKFTGGTEHTLEIGDQTPSMSGYYARLDDGPIVILSSPGIESLIGMLTTPPYLATITPSPAPVTETPTSITGTGTMESLPTATPGTGTPESLPTATP
jgi:hypothetical protein